MNAVLDVLHLMFSEGYARSAGGAVLDAELTSEALRLARELHRRGCRTTTRPRERWR